MRRRLAASALLAAAAWSAWPTMALAQAQEAGGVRFDNRLDLGGSSLQLNGAGVRHKAIFKVYAAGLYLPQKASSPEDVLSQQGPKRISITMLRDIDSNELGKLFTRGVEDNVPKNEFSKLVPGLIRMSEVFSSHRKLGNGDTFTIDWLPGKGTVISVKGQPQGEPFREPEFFNALMRIWLGRTPADHLLKDALLGKAG
jgi:hypothetical protein